MMTYQKTNTQLNRLAIALFQSHHALMMWGEKIAARHNLTTARWKILGALALASKPLTVPQIARNMGLTRQAVQRIIDDLKKQSTIVETDNPDHKRSVCFSLTEIGTELYQAIDTDWCESSTALSAVLDSITIETTINGLSHLTPIFEEAEKFTGKDAIK